jgi:hypothetical protein
LWCVGHAVEPLHLRSFFNVAAEGSMQRGGRGGETEIGRGRRLDGERERERVVAFLLFRLVLFRCYCTLSGKSDRLMNTDYKYENHVSFNQQMCGYQKWNQNSGGYQGSTCLALTSCYSKNQRTSSDMSPPF